MSCVWKVLVKPGSSLLLLLGISLEAGLPGDIHRDGPCVSWVAPVTWKHSVSGERRPHTHVFRVSAFPKSLGWRAGS